MQTFAADVAASARLLRSEAEAAGVAAHVVRLAPPSLARLVSKKLYSSRASPLYVEPIVAGLVGGRGPEGGGVRWTPYLCSQDSLGAPVVAGDFVAAGTCAPSLLGMCEAHYRPGMAPDELWRVAGRCLLGAMDRDCLSGANAVVHLITAEGITSYELRGRHD